MKQRNRAVPAVYMILEYKGKTLLGRRCNTGYYDDFYQFFAGHVDEGELPREAAVRELKEELGVIAELKHLRLVHTQYLAKHDDTGDRVHFFFYVEKWQSEPKNMEPHKCNDLQWFHVSRLPKNMVAHVSEAIYCIERNIPYLELSAERLKELGLYKL